MIMNCHAGSGTRPPAPCKSAVDRRFSDWAVGCESEGGGRPTEGVVLTARGGGCPALETGGSVLLLLLFIV